MAIKKSKQGETRENVYVNEAPRIFLGQRAREECSGAVRKGAISSANV